MGAPELSHLNHPSLLNVICRAETSFPRSTYIIRTPAAAESAMAATTHVAALQIFASGGFAKADAHKEILYKTPTVSFLPFGKSHRGRASRTARFQPQAGGPTTPSDLSSKVSESIGKAEQTCAEDPTSGECVAAWDEVEELSAAASHARDRLKSSDPLEEYCKDNPETDECRTYED